MIESDESIMEMAYEATPNILSVTWSDELSVESAQFLQTIVTLFAAIHEKQVANLIVSSGKPSGGVLTESIISQFIRNIPHTPLRRIAMLESPDYLWDSNLYQVIKMLVVKYKLPITIKVVKDHTAARKWFNQTIEAEKVEAGKV